MWTFRPAMVTTLAEEERVEGPMVWPMVVPLSDVPLLVVPLALVV